MRYYDIIKSLRKVKGLTQRELAGKVGITENYLWMMENKLRLPSPELAKKLAEIIDFNPHVLLGLVLRKKVDKLEDRYFPNLSENLTTTVRYGKCKRA